MHNLIKKDLENLDILSREQHSRKYHDDWYGKGGSDWHFVNGYGPNTIADRVIKKFEGKTFDEAFAYYCTLVPKYQQKFFMQQFDKKSVYWRTCYMLKDGIIKKVPRSAKKTYAFYSDDYKIGYKHKVSGKIISANEYNEGGYQRWWRKFNKLDYEKVVISGWFKNFESSKDPRFIKLMREQEMRKKVAKRKLLLANKNRCYIFLTKDELQKKFDAMESIIIRDKHGFDKTTFMGIEYHGQKRKWKK